MNYHDTHGQEGLIGHLVFFCRKWCCCSQHFVTGPQHSRSKYQNWQHSFIILSFSKFVSCPDCDLLVTHHWHNLHQSKNSTLPIDPSILLLHRDSSFSSEFSSFNLSTSSPESEKPMSHGGIATWKVFARPESFCAYV